MQQVPFVFEYEKEMFGVRRCKAKKCINIKKEKKRVRMRRGTSCVRECHSSSSEKKMTTMMKKKYVVDALNIPSNLQICPGERKKMREERSR